MEMMAVSTMALVYRLFLGAVLLAAAHAKLRARSDFSSTIASFRLVPRALTVPLSAAIPATEVVLGILLVTGIAGQQAALASALVLGVFTTGMAVVFIRDGSVPCSCFGPGEVVGRASFVRNVGLILMALIVFGAPSSPRHDVLAEPGAAVVATAAPLLIAVLTLVMWLVVIQLLRPAAHTSNQLGG